MLHTDFYIINIFNSKIAGKDKAKSSHSCAGQSSPTLCLLIYIHLLEQNRCFQWTCAAASAQDSAGGCIRFKIHLNEMVEPGFHPKMHNTASYW